MKERAYRSKMKNRDVVFISLASSDRFGQPLEYCGVYDLITKREMNAHSIIFKTSQDLDDFAHAQRISFHPTSQMNSRKPVLGEDNRNFVMDIMGKIRNEYELLHIFEGKNIDISNASAFYNEEIIKRSKNIIKYIIQTSKMSINDDLYEALKKFVKAYHTSDIYIDELLVLLSFTSKHKSLVLFVLKMKIIYIIFCTEL